MLANKTMSVDEINDLITNGDQGALVALQAIPSPCVQDSRQETPFNVAVRNDNLAVIGWLLTQPEALNFAPRLDEDLVDPVRYTVAAALDPSKYEKTEEYLSSSFGPNICWQRTPLLTACRWGKRETLEKLLTAKADTKSTDVLGLNALELCWGSGDSELAQLLLGAEALKKQAVKITDTLLQAAVPDRCEYRRLLDHGNLTAGAKRFAFQIACALLDREGAQSLLNGGLKLNSAFNNLSNPLLEAAFSTCLDVYDHPDSPTYVIGERASKSIEVDMAQEEKESRQRLCELTLSQEQKRDLRQPVAEEVQWELAGESTLSVRAIPDAPSARSPFTVELVHDNVYGPDDETRFQVQVAKSAAQNEAVGGGRGEADWLPTRKTQELVMTDKGWTDRAQLPEKLYKETPWQATFVAELKLPAGRHRLEIRVVSSREGVNGILSDWEVRVA